MDKIFKFLLPLLSSGGATSSKRVTGFILLFFGIVFTFLNKEFDIISLYIVGCISIFVGGNIAENIGKRTTNK